MQMTNAQFNACYSSLEYTGIRHIIYGNDNTIKALRSREWIDQYGTITFNGLLAMLEAVLKANRANNVKQLEINRISAAIALFKLS